MNQQPFAAFIIAFNKEGQLAVTSRDKGSESFGLPGGKIDAGETALEGAIREANEEGFSADRAFSQVVHEETVEGQLVQWFLAARPCKVLNNFKEKGRITPLFVDILDSPQGYGNKAAIQKALSLAIRGNSLNSPMPTNF